MKTQAVRLVDVLLLGPFMVWAGARLRRRRSPVAGWIMVASGIATIVYNAKNYDEEEAKLKLYDRPSDQG